MKWFDEPGTRVKSQLVWFGGWLAVTGIAGYLTPNSHGHGTHQQLGLPPCPTVLATNRPCPGCGLTTSWTNLVHLQFARAFESHLLGPFLYLAFSFVAWWAMIGWIRGRKALIDTRLNNHLFLVIVGLFFTYGVIRFLRTPNYQAPHERALSSLLGGRSGDADVSN